MPIFKMRGVPVSETIEFCNRSGSKVFAMIASNDEVDRADEIAAVDGADKVLVGSIDLTIDMGTGGKFDSPKYRTALERIIKVCRTYYKVFGVAGVYDTPEIQHLNHHYTGS
jgi:2-keto-3-deoxy-L-rhamnonate aldolase RhmA